MKNGTTKSPCQLPQHPLPHISQRYKNLIAKELVKDSQVVLKAEDDKSQIPLQRTNFTTATCPNDKDMEEDRNNQEFDDNSNAISYHNLLKMKQSSKQKLQSEIVDKRSITQPLLKSIEDVKKIRVSKTDEEETLKVNDIVKKKVTAELKKEITDTQRKKREKLESQMKQSQAQASEDKQKTVKLAIPKNKKVQQIFQKQPLRQRFSALLRDHQKLQIGINHTRLIRLLRLIDNTIQFASKNNGRRMYFYADLKKNLFSNGRNQITHQHLQKMLFIDAEIFKVQWQHNENIRTYDLMITLPLIKSEEQRLNQFRKKIVEFLKYQELEYLAKQRRYKIEIEQWSEGFQPNLYEIPQMRLPPHPFVQNAEISSFSTEKIQSVSNARLKQLLLNKKREADEKSMCSEDVKKMIFSKQPKDVEETLLQIIKQKETKYANIPKMNPNAIDDSMVIKICQEILYIYMSKAASNIFKATLISILNENVAYKIGQIIECIDRIIEVRQISFLKKHVTSNKQEVLQIDRTKFDQIKKYFKGKKFE